MRDLDGDIRWVHASQSSVKNKVRHLLANYSADIPVLFTPKGRIYLAELKLTDAERFTHAGGHDRQRIAAAQHVLHDIQLLPAKLAVPEDWENGDEGRDGQYPIAGFAVRG